MRRMVTRSTGAGLMIVALTTACSDGTGPEDPGPQEYAFVMEGDAGVIIAGEVAAWGDENGELIEIRETLGGVLDGEEHVWSATAMVRAAFQGGELGGPTGAPDPSPGPAAAPVEVTVGDHTVLVIGLEFTFLAVVGDEGTVTLRGTVNGDTEVSGTTVAGGEPIGKLVLGVVPGG